MGRTKYLFVCFVLILSILFFSGHLAHGANQQPLHQQQHRTAAATAESDSMLPGRDSGKMTPVIPIITKSEDIPLLAEPPFEYSTPAMSDIPHKTISENTADVKKGLLSSILEKVRSKEEADQAARKSARYLAPLASSESLSVSDTSSMKRPLSTTESTMSKFSQSHLIDPLKQSHLKS